MTKKTAHTKGEHSHLRGAPALFCILLVLIAIVLYAGGYFLLSDRWTWFSSGQLRMRVFASEWLADVYQPAAWVESKIRGYPVVAGSQADVFILSP
jgi:hypothetical protein